jgi:hypothetical protein
MTAFFTSARNALYPVRAGNFAQAPKNDELGDQRGAREVSGIENQLCFNRLPDMQGLPKSVPFTLEDKQAGGNVSLLKRGVHLLRLIDRHDLVEFAV